MSNREKCRERAPLLMLVRMGVIARKIRMQELREKRTRSWRQTKVQSCCGRGSRNSSAPFRACLPKTEAPGCSSSSAWTLSCVGTDSRAALRLVDRRGRGATLHSWIVETRIDDTGVIEHPWLGRVRHAWAMTHPCSTWGTAQALVGHRRSIRGVGHRRSTRGHRQSTWGTAPGQEGVVEIAAMRMVDGPNR